MLNRCSIILLFILWVVSFYNKINKIQRLVIPFVRLRVNIASRREGDATAYLRHLSFGILRHRQKNLQSRVCRHPPGAVPLQSTVQYHLLPPPPPPPPPPLLTTTLPLKIKENVCTLAIVPLREKPPQNRSGMERVLNGSHSFTGTPTPSICNRYEPYLPFAFPAIVGAHLLTPEGWKAELAWVDAAAAACAAVRPPPPPPTTTTTITTNTATLNLAGSREGLPKNIRDCRRENFYRPNRLSSIGGIKNNPITYVEILSTKSVKKHPRNPRQFNRFCSMQA